jgi:hypothetical protein
MIKTASSFNKPGFKCFCFFIDKKGKVSAEVYMVKLKD